MQQPVFSIIIPTYNAGKDIVNAINSVVAQTFTQFEVIVFDALSTDNTVSLVTTTFANDERIYVISEKDLGIYDAMNKGVKTAAGEWVYFMGSDDLLYDNKVLENMAPHLTKENHLVYGDVLWVPENKPEQGECKPEDLLHKNINHQRILYRRELFLQYGGYDLQYKVASDHELNIRFFCNQNIRKKYIPITIACYHSGGFSANKTDHLFWNNFKSIFKHNFSKHLSNREMYTKLGWYCRYNIDQHQYRKAFVLFWDVFLHTFNPGFVLLSYRQLIQSFQKNAR